MLEYNGHYVIFFFGPSDCTDMRGQNGRNFQFSFGGRFSTMAGIGCWSWVTLCAGRIPDATRLDSR
jgi:hypothetical protein